jgi:hypothetical protein
MEQIGRLTILDFDNVCEKMTMVKLEDQEDDVIIQSSFAVVLNQYREIMLTNEGTLPSVVDICTTREKLKSFGSEDIIDGKDWKILKTYLGEKFSLDIRSHKLIGFEKIDKNVYNTYYLCNTHYLRKFYISDNSALHYYKFSKLVDFSVYVEHKELFCKIYDEFKINLMLDLDYTLLESSKFGDIKHEYDSITTSDYVSSHGPDRICQIYHYGLLNHHRHIWIRPYLYEFLNKVSELTHVSFWTAGSRDCQEQVMKSIGIYKYGKKFHYIDDCSKTINGQIFKHIRSLNKTLSEKSSDSEIYDINRTLLIDDSPINYDANISNTYMIRPWTITKARSYDDLQYYLFDMELIKSLTYIKYYSDELIHNRMSIQNLLNMR